MKKINILRNRFEVFNCDKTYKLFKNQKKFQNLKDDNFGFSFRLW